MLGIVVLIVFLVVLGLIVSAGFFIPHVTTMSVMDIKKPINTCYALANETWFYKELIPQLSEPQVTPNISETTRATAMVNYKGKAMTWVLEDSIANYRMSAKWTEGVCEVHLQLSFYRLSKNETRWVLIAKRQPKGTLRRLQVALGKSKQKKLAETFLQAAKARTEQFDGEITEFADVDAELNPNFSLH